MRLQMRKGNKTMTLLEIHVIESAKAQAKLLKGIAEWLEADDSTQQFIFDYSVKLVTRKK